MQYTTIAHKNEYFDSTAKTSIKGVVERTTASAYDDPGKYLYGTAARVEIIPETWAAKSIVMSNEGVVLVHKEEQGTTDYVFDLFAAYNDTIASTATNMENAKGVSDIAGKRKLIIDDSTSCPVLTKVGAGYYDIDADALLKTSADGSKYLITRATDDDMYFGFFNVPNYLDSQENITALYYYKPKMLIKSPVLGISIPIKYLGADVSEKGRSSIVTVADTWVSLSDTTDSTVGSYDGKYYIEIGKPSKNESPIGTYLEVI